MVKRDIGVGNYIIREGRFFHLGLLRSIKDARDNMFNKDIEI